MSNIIECRSLSFSYKDGNNQTSVLNNLNFEVELGDSIAILGQSGCGKSTLLNLIAGLDSPSEGDVLINNINIANSMKKIVQSCALITLDSFTNSITYLTIFHLSIMLPCHFLLEETIKKVRF